MMALQLAESMSTTAKQVAAHLHSGDWAETEKVRQAQEERCRELTARMEFAEEVRPACQCTL